MPSRVKKPTILATWALFAAVAAPVFAAEPAPQPYRLAAPPAWVSVAHDISMDNSKPVEEGESDYLFVDHQLRLAAVTGHYLRFTQRMVSQDAVDSAAQISIDIDPEHERALLHDVRVFRNGRYVDKLAGARRSLLNREEDLDEGIINGEVTLHLLLQDVRVGDVLDYSYTIERNDPFGERGYNNDFSTQWRSPVRWFRLRVLQRADRPLQMLDHSKLPKPAVKRNGEWIETTWSGRDIAGLTGDDHRPSWFSFYPRIEISEFADWNAVRAWSQPMYVVQRKESPALAALIGQLKAEPDEAARIVRALRFVQDDIRYTGLEIGAGAYRPTQPATVMERRFGDCKDKVLLLVTLLRAVGVEAHPALVNSRIGRGVADRIPGPGAFDHVIAKVRWNNRNYWLDATVSGQGGGLDHLAQADFGQALVIDGVSNGLESMPARQGLTPSQFVVETFDLSKGRDQTAVFTVKTEYREDEADAMRVKMRSKTVTALGKEYLDYYRKSYKGVRMTKPLAVRDDRTANVFTVEESYAIDKPFEKDKKGKWKFHLEAYVVTDRTGDPEQTERTTPLSRAFPMHVRHQIRVQLPHNWDIDDEVVKIADPAFEYRSAVKYADARLQLDYDLRNTADHVTAAAFKKFAGKLSKVNDDAYYTLTDGGAEAHTGSLELTLPASSPGGPSLPAIMTMLAGILAGAVMAFGLVRLTRRLPEARPDAPAGIGGWMNPTAFAALVLPFLLLNNVRVWLETLGLAAQFERIGDKMQTLFLVELLLQCALLAPSAIAVWLMIKRRHAFPFAFAAVQALIVAVMVNGLLLRAHTAESLLSPVPALAAFSTAIAVCLLAAAYVLRSQRVRATFVNPALAPG